jgi:hypothetical protein
MIYLILFLLICLSGGYIYFNFDRLYNELFWHLSELKDNFYERRLRNERRNR